MEHDDVNTLLSKRYSPAAPQGLAEKIIFKAVTSIQVLPKRSFWNEFGAMFALPHPAVVLACGVILGLVMGLQAGDGLTMLNQDWSSFLDVNEGGWL